MRSHQQDPDIRSLNIITYCVAEQLRRGLASCRADGSGEKATLCTSTCTGGGHLRCQATLLGHHLPSTNDKDSSFHSQSMHRHSPGYLSQKSGSRRVSSRLLCEAIAPYEAVSRMLHFDDSTARGGSSSPATVRHSQAPLFSFSTVPSEKRRQCLTRSRATVSGDAFQRLTENIHRASLRRSSPAVHTAGTAYCKVSWQVDGYSIPLEVCGPPFDAFHKCSAHSVASAPVTVEGVTSNGPSLPAKLVPSPAQISVVASLAAAIKKLRNAEMPTSGEEELTLTSSELEEAAHFLRRSLLDAPELCSSSDKAHDLSHSVSDDHRPSRPNNSTKASPFPVEGKGAARSDVALGGARNTTDSSVGVTFPSNRRDLSPLPGFVPSRTIDPCGTLSGRWSEQSSSSNSPLHPLCASPAAHFFPVGKLQDTSQDLWEGFVSRPCFTRVPGEGGGNSGAPHHLPNAANSFEDTANVSPKTDTILGLLSPPPTHSAIGAGNGTNLSKPSSRMHVGSSELRGTHHGVSLSPLTPADAMQHLEQRCTAAQDRPALNVDPRFPSLPATAKSEPITEKLVLEERPEISQKVTFASLHEPPIQARVGDPPFLRMPVWFSREAPQSKPHSEAKEEIQPTSDGIVEADPLAHGICPVHGTPYSVVASRVHLEDTGTEDHLSLHEQTHVFTPHTSSVIKQTLADAPQTLQRLESPISLEQSTCVGSAHQCGESCHLSACIGTRPEEVVSHFHPLPTECAVTADVGQQHGNLHTNVPRRYSGGPSIDGNVSLNQRFPASTAPVLLLPQRSIPGSLASFPEGNASCGEAYGVESRHGSCCRSAVDGREEGKSNEEAFAECVVAPPDTASYFAVPHMCRDVARMPHRSISSSAIPSAEDDLVFSSLSTSRYSDSVRQLERRSSRMVDAISDDGGKHFDCCPQVAEDDIYEDWDGTDDGMGYSHFCDEKDMCT